MTGKSSTDVTSIRPDLAWVRPGLVAAVVLQSVREGLVSVLRLLVSVRPSVSHSASDEHANDWPGDQCRDGDEAGQRVVFEHAVDAGFVALVGAREDDDIDGDDRANDATDDPADNGVDDPASPARFDDSRFAGLVSLVNSRSDRRAPRPSTTLTPSATTTSPTGPIARTRSTSTYTVSPSSATLVVMVTTATSANAVTGTAVVVGGTRTSVVGAGTETSLSAPVGTLASLWIVPNCRAV